MSRFSVSAALLVSALFALALAVLRVLPQNVAFDRFFERSESCTMPCWHGIQPGVTLRTEALERLAAIDWLTLIPETCALAGCPIYNYIVKHNPAQVVSIRIEKQRVYEIMLRSPGLTLGDVWLAQGEPDFGSLLGYYTVQKLLAVQSGWLFRASGMYALTQVECPPVFPVLLRTPLDRVILRQRFEPMPTLDVFQTRHGLSRVCQS